VRAASGGVDCELVMGDVVEGRGGKGRKSPAHQGCVSRGRRGEGDGGWGEAHSVFNTGATTVESELIKATACLLWDGIERSTFNINMERRCLALVSFGQHHLGVG
jgi:hypothetical protein